MFEQYSDRARRVVFLTRLKAGRRGAPALEPEHLVEALVFEDQGKSATAFIVPNEVAEVIAAPGIELHHPFLSSDIASEVLMELERVFTKSEPIPDSTDMPMSPALGVVFNAAMALRSELGCQQVEPLHLLAATLSESGSKASDVLKRAGVTKEAVIAAIRAVK